MLHHITWRVGTSVSHLLPWRRRQRVPSKYLYLSTRWHYISDECHLCVFAVSSHCSLAHLAPSSVFYV